MEFAEQKLQVESSSLLVRILNCNIQVKFWALTVLLLASLAGVCVFALLNPSYCSVLEGLYS